MEKNLALAKSAIDAANHYIIALQSEPSALGFSVLCETLRKAADAASTARDEYASRPITPQPAGAESPRYSPPGSPRYSPLSPPESPRYSPSAPIDTKDPDDDETPYESPRYTPATPPLDEDEDRSGKQKRPSDAPAPASGAEDQMQVERVYKTPRVASAGRVALVTKDDPIPPPFIVHRIAGQRAGSPKAREYSGNVHSGMAFIHPTTPNGGKRVSWPPRQSEVADSFQLDSNMPETESTVFVDLTKD